MTSPLKATILSGSDALNFSLDRYLRYLFKKEIEEIHMARLGYPESLEPEMLSSDLWIIEAFNFQNDRNPEGFRTAKKFAGKARILLLFIGDVPEGFPAEGDFWIKIPSLKPLSQKIEEVLALPPPTLEAFQVLEEKWPQLKWFPSHHHHR